MIPPCAAPFTSSGKSAVNDEKGVSTLNFVIHVR